MEVHLLNKQNSLLHQFVAELRDITIQKDRARFRKNIERIGQIMAYEISKSLEWKQVEVTTPLGKHLSFSACRTACIGNHFARRFGYAPGLIGIF
jgi:uracil phosphoribosyltransferase